MPHGKEEGITVSACLFWLQAYSRDVLSFIFLVLTAVNLWKAPRKYKAADLLNRQQTDEWKGWMQARHIGSQCLCLPVPRHVASFVAPSKIIPECSTQGWSWHTCVLLRPT